MSASDTVTVNCDPAAIIRPPTAVFMLKVILLPVVAPCAVSTTVIVLLPMADGVIVGGSGKNIGEVLRVCSTVLRPL